MTFDYTLKSWWMGSRYFQPGVPLNLQLCEYNYSPHWVMSNLHSFMYSFMFLRETTCSYSDKFQPIPCWPGSWGLSTNATMLISLINTQKTRRQIKWLTFGDLRIMIITEDYHTHRYTLITYPPRQPTQFGHTYIYDIQTYRVNFPGDRGDGNGNITSKRCRGVV